MQELFIAEDFFSGLVQGNPYYRQILEISTVGKGKMHEAAPHVRDIAIIEKQLCLQLMPQESINDVIERQTYNRDINEARRFKGEEFNSLLNKARIMKNQNYYYLLKQLEYQDHKRAIVIADWKSYLRKNPWDNVD